MKYISKDNMDLIKSLAQKSYDKKILRCVEKRLNHISKLLKDYKEGDIENIYLNECVSRQNLVTPVELTYEQLVQSWLSMPYEGKEFTSECPVILTNNGMRVRSKSEKIMADYFDSLGIKYKYECPLKLNSNRIVYPDFTFISPYTRKEIYWEHEGMLDNPEYAKCAVKKLDSYAVNHIFPGENLILTFESSDTVINMNVIKEMTKKYLQS
ncbi:MAG: hypothetical protein E7254_05710 [Lachnospiraceae bacterium]|nr:hypothetical protein [Lachnospiraceae bacterium]